MTRPVEMTKAERDALTSLEVAVQYAVNECYVEEETLISEPAARKAVA